MTTSYIPAAVSRRLFSHEMANCHNRLLRPAMLTSGQMFCILHLTTSQHFSPKCRVGQANRVLVGLRSRQLGLPCHNAVNHG